MSHSTHDRSFQKQSSQPITWLVQKPAFLANQLAGTSKTNVTITTLQHKNHTTITKKTTNAHKTKPDRTKAWLRSPFTPSGQETDWTYSIAPGARRGLSFQMSCSHSNRQQTTVLESTTNEPEKIIKKITADSTDASCITMSNAIWHTVVTTDM